jgi:hypothetical protein
MSDDDWLQAAAMYDGWPSYAEVCYSLEYQQYALILDEASAYHYARDELIAARERALRLAAVPPPLPYSEAYRAYLQTPEWRARADEVKSRFGGRCALCNAEGNPHAHHRTYVNVFNQQPDDLIALCGDCHQAYRAVERSAAAERPEDGVCLVGAHQWRQTLTLPPVVIRPVALYSGE